MAQAQAGVGEPLLAGGKWLAEGDRRRIACSINKRSRTAVPKNKASVDAFLRHSRFVVEKFLA